MLQYRHLRHQSLIYQRIGRRFHQAPLDEGKVVPLYLHYPLELFVPTFGISQQLHHIKMVNNQYGKVVCATKLPLQYHTKLPSKRLAVLPTRFRMLQSRPESMGPHNTCRLPRDPTAHGHYRTRAAEQIPSNLINPNSKHTQGSHPNGNKFNSHRQYRKKLNLHHHLISLMSL